jgi:hypothetical protein
MTSPNGICAVVKPSDNWVGVMKIFQLRTANPAIAVKMRSNSKVKSFIMNTSYD